MLGLLTRPTVKPPIGPVLNVSHPLATHLTAAWPFWDCGGGKVQDLMCHNPGVMKGALTWVPGQAGNTGIDSTSATGNYISTGNRNFPTTGYSAALAFKIRTMPPASGWSQLLGYTLWNSPNPSAQSALDFWINGVDSKLITQVTTSSGNYIGRQTEALSTGTLYSAVTTWDGGTASSSIKIYLNGVQSDTTDNSGGTFTTPAVAAWHVTIFQSDFGVNGTTPGGMFDGQIYYCYEWDRALSLNEVQYLRSSPDALFYQPRGYAGWGQPALATYADGFLMAGMGT